MKKEDAHSAPRRPPSIPSQWCVCRDVPRLGEMGVVHPRCTQEGKGAFPLKTWPTACVCSGIVSFNSRRGRKPDEILLEQLQQRLVSWSFRAMHQRFPTRHFWVLTNYMLKLLPRSTFFKEKTPTSSPPPQQNQSPPLCIVPEPVTAKWWGWGPAFSTITSLCAAKLCVRQLLAVDPARQPGHLHVELGSQLRCTGGWLPTQLKHN